MGQARESILVQDERHRSTVSVTSEVKVIAILADLENLTFILR